MMSFSDLTRALDATGISRSWFLSAELHRSSSSMDFRYRLHSPDDDLLVYGATAEELWANAQAALRGEAPDVAVASALAAIGDCRVAANDAE